jgi:hypothetical protein
VLVATVTLGIGGLAQAGASSAEPVAASGGGALATYNGRTIDLSYSWEGAKVCVEQADSDLFECYKDDAAYRAATGSDADILDLSDCDARYLCLWDNRYWAGRRVQFIRQGGHHLSDVGFANKANGYFNNRDHEAGLDDLDQNCDSYLVVGANEAHNNLSVVPNDDCGGSWNNKIDYVAG